MKSSFSPSINIIRDAKTDYDYIITPNAISTVDKIIGNFKTGFHSSIIIGSYGTGKSKFLWALEQSLVGAKNFFNVAELKSPKSKVKFLSLVGEYDSIINSFSETLGVKIKSPGNQQIFDAIFQKFEEAGKNGVLVIYIDELGKYLEYASKNNPEKELYFLQQLAEFVNHPQRNIILICTLHQNFDAYAFKLSTHQKEEWTKVKGRFLEITFNEPVEQLLSLAAKHNSHKSLNINASQLDKINSLSISHNLFSKTSNEYVRSIGKDLSPIDFITAYCLTLCLQKYGQNERSLFTFLESSEYKLFLLSDKDQANYFNLSNLFDYLWTNYYTFLTSKNNPHFANWMDIRDSFERIESQSNTDIEDLKCIIKVIGILKIFSSKGANINRIFLEQYLKLACKISKPDISIDFLEKKKIILYSRFNDSFKLFQGTDIDIDEAWDKAELKFNKDIDVISLLTNHFKELPLITAKKVTYQKGTPRVFKFMVGAEPVKYKPEGAIDGYVTLVINERIDQKTKELVDFSKTDEDANLYGIYLNSELIKSFLLGIEKANHVMEENPDDSVLKKEMNDIKSHYYTLLRYYFLDAVYTGGVKWFFRGKEVGLPNKRLFNQQLSRIAEEVYGFAPTLKNELINRDKIPASIHNARKNLFQRLVNNWTEKDLGFDDRFPPEKTIYSSLLRENGMHRKVVGVYSLGAPDKKSTFNDIWKASELFLEESKSEKKSITDLYNLLLEKPYKIKLGFAELWVPIFLFIKRDDFALFGESGYIPEINENILSLFARNAKEYSVKAFNIEGVKLDIFNRYREFLKQSPQLVTNNESFIESIKPFIVFYRQLPEYSKNTRKLSNEAFAIREAIIKSTDPEMTFFNDFPLALHTTIREISESQDSLQQYITRLRIAINELRDSFNALIERFEDFICNEIVSQKLDFIAYKKELRDRFKGVKTYYLLNQHKTFLQMINSKLDDKHSWLSSLSQALINKPLSSLTDIDEVILFDKFKTAIHELDNFSDISTTKSDESKEKVYKFEITAEKTSTKQIVKIPKSKFEEAEIIKDQINGLLKSDKQLNIAILTNLLQEHLKK